MKTFYPDENNVFLNENSVEKKPCINRKNKSNELTIRLYSCHDINMKFLVVLIPPSIYHKDIGRKLNVWLINKGQWIVLREAPLLIK